MFRRLLSLLLVLSIGFCFSNLAFATSKSSTDVHVNGYYRKDGTYVKPYYRTAPDATKLNNFSHCGNTNPYTGKVGNTECGIDASGYDQSNANSNVTIQSVEQSLPSGSVKVMLPSFAVNVNDEKRQLPNSLRKYPVVIYKDITYFPMTWSYTHAWGLETNWSGDTGFSIRKSNNGAEPLGNEDVGVNDSQSYVATIANYNVFINDSWVDNSNEEYPIISFRDITYLPMTWNIANELGLITSWSSTYGFGVKKQ
jgi:hypothetical protein